MAFPQTSLTNNQVHKEGNRAFVYDSALGVWDQVRETDRTENKIQTQLIHEQLSFRDGQIEHIATVVGGGTAVNIEFPYNGGYFDGNYSRFKVIGEHFRASLNDTHLYLRLADTTGFWTSSNYTRTGYMSTHDSGSTVGPGNSTANNDVFFHNGASSDAEKTVYIEIDIYNAQDTNHNKVLYLKAGGGRQNGANNLHGASIWVMWNNSSTALTGLKIYGNQGLLYGTLKLYGIR
jgi:hypothetical protein